MAVVTSVYVLAAGKNIYSSVSSAAMAILGFMTFHGIVVTNEMGSVRGMVNWDYISRSVIDGR